MRITTVALPPTAGTPCPPSQIRRFGTDRGLGRRAPASEGSPRADELGVGGCCSPRGAENRRGEGVAWEAPWWRTEVVVNDLAHALPLGISECRDGRPRALRLGPESSVAAYVAKLGVVEARGAAARCAQLATAGERAQDALDPGRARDAGHVAVTRELVRMKCEAVGDDAVGRAAHHANEEPKRIMDGCELADQHLCAAVARFDGGVTGAIQRAIDVHALLHRPARVRAARPGEEVALVRFTPARVAPYLPLVMPGDQPHPTCVLPHVRVAPADAPIAARVVLRRAGQRDLRANAPRPRSVDRLVVGGEAVAAVVAPVHVDAQRVGPERLGLVERRDTVVVALEHEDGGVLDADLHRARLGSGRERNQGC